MSKLSAEDMLTINRCCDALENAFRNWRDHEGVPQPRLEEFLSDVPARLVDDAIEYLAPIEIEYRLADGQTLLVTEFEKRFPSKSIGFFIELLQESISGSPAGSPGQTELAFGPTDDSHFSTDGGDEADDDRPPPRIGQYEIIGKLGGGGMGTVYQAVHRQMQRDVAIKVMRGDLVDRPELQKRFRREVLAAAKLVHPHVVTAYDAGEIEGRPFLVTELIDGFDLRRYVKDNGPMPWVTAVRCITDAAEGLKYAHEHDVVHRDIKPANLLMDRSGTVKVLDLGLARLTVQTSDREDDTEATAQLTETGVVMGTAGYMAPEQARNTRKADARSDVYSLGCVLFFLISGRPPYRGASMVDTILEHATAPIPKLRSPESIPDALSELVTAMMAKDPVDRPQSMDELLVRLQAISSEAVSPRREAAVSAMNPPSRSESAVTAVEDSPPRNATAQQKTGRASGVDGGSKMKLRLVMGLAGVMIFISLVSAVVYFNSSGDTPADDDNRALVFRGNEFVYVPSIVTGPGDAVTVELIAKVDETRVSNAVSWLGENWMALFHNGRWGVSRRQDGQSLFSVADDSGRDSTGRWQHVAGTWDGQSLRVYVDGRLVEQGPIIFELPETEPGLYIGGVDPTRLPSSQNDRFFNGAIDAVRITDRVLYAGSQTFSPPSRLEAVEGTLVLLQFDEDPEATIFRDSSGNGNDAQGVEIESMLVR